MIAFDKRNLHDVYEALVLVGEDRGRGGGGGKDLTMG